jgi:hypothetical protein
MAQWKDISHNGYTVKSFTLKTHQGSVASNYTPEFTIPPKTDFWVICNYDSVTTSVTCHVEMFYSDVPGGTFNARTKTGGYWFNATSAAIGTAVKSIPQDVSTVKEHPRYKMKVTGNAATNKGGGLVKFVIYYAPGVTW